MSEDPPAVYPRPIINIEGRLVALGPMRRDLVETYTRWDNDYGTRRTDDPSEARPMTLEEGFGFYDEWARDRTRRNIMFTIYDTATWRPIGTTGLRDLDWRNRNAVFGIAINEPEFRGKGYGTEATTLVLDQAFTVMGMHSVLLDAMSSNPAGIRAYQKAGFREIGRWRESVWVNGTYHDTVFMECLASEFESPVLAQVFDPSSARTEP